MPRLGVKKVLAQKNRYEKDFPAQQPAAAAHPRLPGPDADQGGPGDHQPSPTEGAQAPVGLTVRDHRFPRLLRVRKSVEFRRVYDGGSKIVRRGFVLFYLPNGTTEHRLGITVTKRIGNAAVRNLCKRRIREAFRRNRRDLGTEGVDCVIHARAPLGSLTGREVEQEFRRCGAKVRKEMERGRASLPGSP